jgi:hypothetical protein
MTFFIQILLAVSLLAFLGQWRHARAKRNHQSWDQIVAALRTDDWPQGEFSERYLDRGGIKVVPPDIWKRLWAMYTNAPLLVQLADYAAEDSTNPDEALLEALRGDAFQIRICALIALVKCLAT